jgi:UDP-N-acetylmuramoylalanine--D-glutamate ligase
MAAYLAGVSVNTIKDVLKSFKGLEYRLELVAKINGVEYYNDSFSTIPETTIAAIESFKNPEILILGGSSKNSDFRELGEVIGKKENIKAIIGIGDEWERIKSEILNPKSEFVLIEGADSMEKIVQAASKIAIPGDIVLLSPACASFGMFENYKDRGNQFKEEVNKLKQETSQ